MPIQYPIEPVKHTTIGNLLQAKHKKILVQGISNFLELPNKGIREYLQNSNNNTNKNTNRNTQKWSYKRNNNINIMNRSCIMNDSINKLEKPEKKSPLYWRAKVNKRKSIAAYVNIYLLERVESIVKIQRWLERCLENRWFQIDMEIDGINLLQIYLLDNKLKHHLEAVYCW